MAASRSLRRRGSNVASRLRAGPTSPHVGGQELLLFDYFLGIHEVEEADESGAWRAIPGLALAAAELLAHQMLDLVVAGVRRLTAGTRGEVRLRPRRRRAGDEVVVHGRLRPRASVRMPTRPNYRQRTSRGLSTWHPRRCRDPAPRTLSRRWVFVRSERSVPLGYPRRTPAAVPRSAPRRPWAHTIQ